MSDDPTTSHPTFQPVPPTSEPLPPADPVAPMSPGGTPIAAGAGGPVLEPVRPVPAPPAKGRASSGRWLNLLLGVAVAVAIGGVAFAVGRSTAPAQASTFQRGAGSGNGNFVLPGGSFDPNAAGNGGANGGGGFGRFGLGGGGVTINGTVDAVSADSITITTASGQQITLSLGSDTAYHTQTPATASDVTTGSKVAVQVQVTGGFRGNGNNGNGNGGTGNNGNGNGNNGNGGTGNGGAPALRGTASDVTVIP